MARPLDNEHLQEEAATWFSKLRTTSVDAATLEAFFAWRAAPENEAAYNKVEALWRKGEGLSSDPDILNAAREALARPAAGKRRSRSNLPAMAATLALVSAGALGGVAWLSRAPTYATDVGEQRTVRLADGSNLTLDTDSRAVIHLKASERKVVLERGQALFTVTPDPARPFIVSVGDTEVRALGTRFDVRREGDAVRVTLIEGKVKVHDVATRGDWTLTAGEQVTTGGGAIPVRADTAAVTSWTSGRLVFRDQPLLSAVEEANRYSTRKVRLAANGDIGQVRVSGVFNTGDVDALAEAVAHLYGLDLRPARNGDLVLQKRPE